MLISKPQIVEAIEDGEIVIEPFEENNLEGASYDARLGNEGIVTQEVDLDEIKDEIQRGSANKIDIETEISITIPAGGLALVTTFEKFSLSNRYVGHIGLKSYYVRKGIGLLSGLQIDPGYGNPPATLVLAIKNLSTRSITIDHKDDICSIEFHKLNEPAPEFEKPRIEAEQRRGKIPKDDVDYLRTIEAMSISEMTEALLSLSRTVEELSSSVEEGSEWGKRTFWLLAIAFSVGFILLVIELVIL